MQQVTAPHGILYQSNALFQIIMIMGKSLTIKNYGGLESCQRI